MPDPTLDFSLLSFPELLAVDTLALSPERYAEWEEEYQQRPVGFVERKLQLELYNWQDDTLIPLDELVAEDGSVKRVEISLVAPNGSGKSERVVAGAVLYWLATYPRGRVIVTSKDSKQINEQVWPALTRHRPKFQDWHWVTSPYCKIVTPTGGTAILYTTNDEGRAEGAHMDFDPWNGNFDGPLLIIIDEAKSVDENIFEALDRCGYNVRMLVSSPGRKQGTFYQSQTEFRDNPYICVQAGWEDCPHIPRAKFDSLTAKYKDTNPQYLRSVLHGEFMDSEMVSRFDREGLAHIQTLVSGLSPKFTDARIDPIDGGAGSRVKQVSLVVCALADPSRWFRFWERPIPGCRYFIMCDSSKARKDNVDAKEPDRQSVIVFRDVYIDQWGIPHKPAAVARIIPPCLYRIEKIAPLIACLSLFYGGCTVGVEENNTGLALILLLKAAGVPVYRRKEGTPENPKYEDGVFTHAYIRPLIIAELADAIYQKEIDVWCPHILGELRTFVTKPDGKEEAEGSLKDDDVICCAWGRRLLPSGTIYKGETLQRRQTPRLAGSAS